MNRRMLISTVALLVAAPVLAGTVTGSTDCSADCASVVVYLDGLPAESEEGMKAVFDQKNKVFIPHLLPIVRGTTVDIKNSDPFLHNVRIYNGKNTLLNQALPFQGQVVPHVFEETGTYAVRCDAHPEMSAFIVVLENQFFSTVNEDGSYEIAGVPPGSYSLVTQNLKKEKIDTSTVVVH